MDIITDGYYACFHSRSTVAICAPGFTYLPDYWFSRYPAKIPATWNLVLLFDPPGWTLLFLSIIGVTLVFFLSARLGTKFGIRTFEEEEIIFSPFRQMLDPQIETNKMFGLNRKFLNEYLRSNFDIKSSISDTSTILQRKLQHFGIPRKIQVIFLPPRLENQVPIWFLHKNAVLALVCLWGIPAPFLREFDP